MVIHRRTPRNIPTAPYMVSGYVWQRWPRRRITSTFVAVSPLRGHLINTPYVNIEREFFLPRTSPPEVYDTIVQVSCYKLLVTGYLNSSLGPNPNLQRDFPLIPWKGEIAVLFIGKRKPYVSRAPPQSLVRFAITQYMEVCIAHAEVGSPFPSYIKSIWPGHGRSWHETGHRPTDTVFDKLRRTTMGPETGLTSESTGTLASTIAAVF
ncbi:hypothetical protein EDB86DRAFT_2835131 [Lactarius hatsudake]|nr:hypothetical protein EDB86DRAFT_2835131 [Lactarius hatsudake]